MTFRTAAAALAVGTILALGPATAQTGQEASSAEADAIEAERVRAEVAEAIDAIKTYSLQKRDEAIAEAGDALDALDAAIEKRERSLRQNWSSMSEAAREEASETLADLRNRRDSLGEWYGALRHGAGNAWDDIKDGFSAAYSDLRSAWERADEAGAERGKNDAKPQ